MNIWHIPQKCRNKKHLSGKTPEPLSKSLSSSIGYLMKSCIEQLQLSKQEVNNESTAKNSSFQQDIIAFYNK